MLHIPGHDYVAPEWRDLARQLVEGDGLGWPGDPRLSLQIGIIEGRNKSGRVVRTGRRLEVVRHNEDGSDTMIGHWRPEEQHRVCYDLARMRVDSPGHESVLDSIDRANAQKEAEVSKQFQEAMANLLDHAARLHHDLSNPRNRFYMGGDGRRGARA